MIRILQDHNKKADAAKMQKTFIRLNKITNYKSGKLARIRRTFANVRQRLERYPVADNGLVLFPDCGDWNEPVRRITKALVDKRGLAESLAAGKRNNS